MAEEQSENFLRPVHQYLNKKHLKNIVQTIKQFYKIINMKIKDKFYDGKVVLNPGAMSM